jgi:hypothetical protein
MQSLEHPRHTACRLVNEYATLKASLESATAETRAQIVNLTAALNAAAAPYELKLKSLEDEAKALALTHGLDIFGEDKRSLTENGFTLALKESAAVQVDDEDAAIRMLQKDAQRGGSDDTAMACNACLRTVVTLDREYILRHYDEAPMWFEQYGIAVVDKESASLKPAPKPRVSKAKTKIKTAEPPMEQEAA